MKKVICKEDTVIDASAIKISNLVKCYGENTAINGVSLSVAKGEVYGLLGPNGAGKTTLLECLEGIRKPSAGSIIVAGCNPKTSLSDLRKKMGVQLQVSALPDSIQVGEAIALITAWRGSPRGLEVSKEFGILNLQKKKYGQLSMGQKRQLQLVLALVSNPEVVILDEPTAGLDVQSRVQLHAVIRKIKEQGITVLLATHDMAEAEDLCDRISIMMGGNIVLSGTPDEITAAGNKHTRMRLRSKNSSLVDNPELEGAKFICTKNNYIEWDCKDVSKAINALLVAIQFHTDTIEDLRVERPSLEERFLEVVEGEEK